MSIFGTHVNEWKRIISRYLFKSAIIAGLLIIPFACAKDPDKLGRELLPASDSINVKIDTSTFINSYTISGKPVFTADNPKNPQLYVLGSENDSIFGLSTASILTRFHPSMLVSADSIRKVDSLVLYLSSAGSYGDTLSPLTLRVYELNDTMSLDSNYYSDINPLEYTDLLTELGTTIFTVRDSIIRVKITDEGILSHFQTLPDSIFKDLSDFRKQFLGLFLQVDPVSEKGGFSYLNMSSFDTRLTMYYNGKDNGDSISNGYEMSFTSIAAKANLFSHEYTGFPISGHMNVPDSKDSLLFIEGLAGASGRISLPELDKWRAKGLIAINKAELIFPVDTIFYPSFSKDNYPPKLFLFSLDENGEYDYLYDHRIDESGTYFDGSYNASMNAYVFNIGLHLQSFIDDRNFVNRDFILVSKKNNSTANRVILKGATSDISPVKLKVIYTELF